MIGPLRLQADMHSLMSLYMYVALFDERVDNHLSQSCSYFVCLYITTSIIFCTVLSIKQKVSAYV